MKRTLAILLTVVLTALLLCSCTPNAKKDISGAQSLTDLAGARISAQSGTFHEDALKQLPNSTTSSYSDFPALLTALNSGVIDGYIAEEPTALAMCLQDSTLGYVKLKNNTTGFTATDADVGIAVGVKEGSDLAARISAVLADVSVETREALMEQMVKISAGETVDTLALTSEKPATTSGTLKIAMECAYEPFNWTDTTGSSIGAYPISGEGKEGLYCNGYDVQIAIYLANKLGMGLEIYALEWNSLIPAVQSDTVDGIIAGMSPTAERDKEVDFSDVYYSSNLVVIYKK